MRGASVGIYARAWLGLPSLADKEKPRNFHLFNDDQSYGAKSAKKSSKVSVLNHFFSLSFL